MPNSCLPACPPDLCMVTLGYVAHPTGKVALAEGVESHARGRRVAASLAPSGHVRTDSEMPMLEIAHVCDPLVIKSAQRPATPWGSHQPRSRLNPSKCETSDIESPSAGLRLERRRAAAKRQTLSTLRPLSHAGAAHTGGERAKNSPGAMPGPIGHQSPKTASPLPEPPIGRRPHWFVKLGTQAGTPS